MEDLYHQLTSESLSAQEKRHVWETIIKDQQSSGLKQAEYCRRHNRHVMIILASSVASDMGIIQQCC